MNLTQILAQESFMVVNKVLAKQIGLYESIILSDLCSKFEYFKRENRLTKDGFFFNSADNIERDTTLSRKKQIQPIKHLKELGILDTTLRGMPAIQHFRINQENLNRLIVQTSLDKKDNLDDTKSKNKIRQNGSLISNNINNNISNNNKVDLEIHFPNELLNISFKTKWDEWIKYRKELKKGLTSSTAIKQIKMLSAYQSNIACEMLEQSMVNGWQGIFELKNKPKEDKDIGFQHASIEDGQAEYEKALAKGEIRE